MERRLFSVVLALTAALPIAQARAALAEDAGFGEATKPLMGESVALQMKNGFGAEFWFVDGEHTLPKWLSGDVRGITPVSVIKRSRRLRLLVFILNPGSHPLRISGKEEFSDVTYDVLMRRPDGVRYTAAKGITAWDGPAPAANFVQTAQVTVSDSFRKTDLLGEYTVMVVVHDNVRKVDIPLIHTLTVRE